MSSTFHFFGIRHHGPACARSLLEALITLKPDCILVEGPPDADNIISLVAHQDMQPPVALLVYAQGQMEHAAFYPFAEYSPEWQALRFGTQQAIETRFMDLPYTYRFANKIEQSHELAELHVKEISKTKDANKDVELNNKENTGDESTDSPANQVDKQTLMRVDPLSYLAEAAGYADGETWWNMLIEEKTHSSDIFAAVAEAMSALRDAETNNNSDHIEISDEAVSLRTKEEAQREAYMRTTMREAAKKGYQRIAVVCGAWHVPALQIIAEKTTLLQKEDQALLKPLSKSKVEATWVPWTYDRISRDSGYGAGITSPQWYAHLWHYANDPNRNVRWLAKVATLFRKHDIDCSSAHLIEAAHLADALAAMRLRQQAGLDELMEAVKTVICQGYDTPLRLIEKALIIGHEMGCISAESPSVPLQQDLERQQKTLRLKPETLPKTLDLDLRKPPDLAKSELLHRLNALGINWGDLNETGASKNIRGTFHEIWQLQWQPEMVIHLIERSAFGSTIQEAAGHCLVAEANQQTQIDSLAHMIKTALWANLPLAVNAITLRLSSVAAIATDTVQFLRAIPPLVSILRYGNVRQTNSQQIAHVVQEMVIRVEVSLLGACASLDDDAAIAMYRDIKQFEHALSLLVQIMPDLSDDWHACLHRLADLGQTHRLISGIATRLLFDKQAIDIDCLERMLQLALSTGHEPIQVATWFEGFLNENATVLLHHTALWTLLDTWLTRLNEEAFISTLPLLRRAFGGFSPTDRHQLAQRAKEQSSNQVIVNALPLISTFDFDRAALCLPILAKFLGSKELST